MENLPGQTERKLMLSPTFFLPSEESVFLEQHQDQYITSPDAAALDGLFEDSHAATTANSFLPRPPRYHHQHQAPSYLRPFEAEDQAPSGRHTESEGEARTRLRTAYLVVEASATVFLALVAWALCLAPLLGWWSPVRAARAERRRRLRRAILVDVEEEEEADAARESEDEGEGESDFAYDADVDEEFDEEDEMDDNDDDDDDDYV